MKKLIIGFVLLTALGSCKKDNTSDCYECKILSSSYEDQGCYTEAQWDQFQPTTANGTAIDKSTACRKK